VLERCVSVTCEWWRLLEEPGVESGFRMLGSYFVRLQRVPPLMLLCLACALSSPAGKSWYAQTDSGRATRRPLRLACFPNKDVRAREIAVDSS
jgi:hypothetical protein